MSEAAKKTAFLSMPGYGGTTMASARGFYRAARDDGPISLRLLYTESSLLAANFNIHWASALNCELFGNPIDYFAMLHSDVQPVDYWIDELVEEMEKRGLDILSAVVPIKDGRGMTSTGLGNPENSWRPHFRLTVKEVYDLPETFTAADLGHPDKPLLINTGCWVCRFDHAWASKIHFQVNDRIIMKDGRYQQEVEPEDWHFSRIAHGLGLKVGATRKVALSHRGPAEFTNTRVWGGWTYDQEYAERPPVFPEVVVDGGELESRTKTPVDRSPALEPVLT